MTAADETPAQPKPRAFVVRPGPMSTAPVDGEVCCVCGSTDVGYHNYRNQPFCWPCADGKGPHDAQPDAAPAPGGNAGGVGDRLIVGRDDIAVQDDAGRWWRIDDEPAVAVRQVVAELTRANADLRESIGARAILDAHAEIAEIGRRIRHLEARVGTAGGERGFQYGHVIEGEWRWEPRGARYASHQRPWWTGAPEPIARDFGAVESVTDDGPTS